MKTRRLFALRILMAVICLFSASLLVAAAGIDGDWHIVPVDTVGDVGDSARLALDGSDLPHIAYLDLTYRNLKYAYSDGEEWYTETVHTAYPTGDQSLALDTEGHPHIAWHSYTPSYSLMYSYHDGVSWRTENVGPRAWPSGISLALDSEDHPHIAYLTDVDGGPRANSLIYTWHDGTSWHSQKVDGPSVRGMGIWLVLDPSDCPHIAYTHNTARVLKYARCDDPTGDWHDNPHAGWDIETAYGDGQIWGPLSLVLDPTSGHPRIAVLDRSRNELWYFWSDGESWDHEYVADASYYTRISLVLDREGDPHVNYATCSVEPDCTVEYGYRYDGVWLEEEVAVGYSSWLVLDSLYEPHIAFDDYIADDLRYATRPLTLPAIVDIDPDTLNLKAKGTWVTAHVELPEGSDVALVDVSTVVLEGVIPAEGNPTEVGDHDDDGVPDLMVKFDRQALVEHLGETTGQVTLTVTGQVAGTPFEGSDTITVIRRGKK